MQEIAVTHLVRANPVLSAGGAEGEGRHLHPLGARCLCLHCNRPFEWPEAFLGRTEVQVLYPREAQSTVEEK